MNTDNILLEISKKADQVFLNPETLYTWEEIITGAYVLREDGSTEKMKAVAPNTARAFHRIDKTKPGILEVFEDYFINKKSYILNMLKNIKHQKELHNFSNIICMQIKFLTTNIKQDSLISYNRVRKPIDLFIENLVVMSKDLASDRKELVPFLYQPLDSWILQNQFCFSEIELSNYGLTKNSALGSVKTENVYLELQAILEKKAINISKSIGKNFYSIFFDMLWNDRYKNWGRNLFETNPSRVFQKVFKG